MKEERKRVFEYTFQHKYTKEIVTVKNTNWHYATSEAMNLLKKQGEDNEVIQLDRKLI